MNEAYQKAGHNAYFENGFYAGVDFCERNTGDKTLLLIGGEFPENLPLYKDSGLWQVRSDNMEDVLFQQELNEEFSEFIERVINNIAEKE